jgi:DNA modification methylase
MRKNPLNDLDASEWVRRTRSWFICDGRPRDITPDIERHPATFPPEMLERFIGFFTREGETVLDPFVGCGSTLVAAYTLGRRSIGIELSERFHAATATRLSRLPDTGFPKPTLHLGDARDVLDLVAEQVDYCLTSPPYWDMLKRSRGQAVSSQKRRAARGLDTDYGSDPRDLGTIAEYDRYLAELADLFGAVGERLRPGGYLTVVMQNVRVKGGEMVPLAWDFAAKMRERFSLQQETIWCQNQKRLACWGFPSTFVSNVHHHYCLTFRKPDLLRGSR